MKKEEEIIEANISSVVILGYIILFIVDIYWLYYRVSHYTLGDNNEFYAPINILLLITGVAIIVHTIRAILLKITTKLYFNKTKIVGKVGVLNIKTLDAPLNKINDIYIIKSLLGRILNYSRIVISTSSSKYIFSNVYNAEEFKNKLTSYIDNIDENKQNKINNNSNYDELKKLKNLLDENIITKEEFEKEKSKLLNK